jgi:glycosyltransferase involved in cell wall biosynthesis
MRRRGKEFDVVHAHNYQGIAALVGGFSHRQPFVFTPHYHGSGHTYLARRLHTVYRPFGKGLFQRADQIICVSDAERRTLIRKHPLTEPRISVIPNGITEMSVSVKPQDWGSRRVIAHVGRLEPYKRLDLVIEAMSFLPEDVHLIVVGSGRDESRLLALASRLKLGDHVEFVGALTDEGVAEVLARARVLVTASQHEAFGMIVLEARQAGARVVASALEAHREVAQLDFARAVDLWQPETGSNGLATIIRHALNGADPGVLTSVPRWADVAVNTVEIYQRAIAHASPGARIVKNSIRATA